MKLPKLAIIISIIILVIASAVWLWFFRFSSIPVITDALDSGQAASAAVLKDLASFPALALTGDNNEYIITDDPRSGGITVERPNRPEIKAGEDEEKKETLSIKLPKSIKDGIKIELLGGREIIINDSMAQAAQAQVLSRPAPEIPDLPGPEALDKQNGKILSLPPPLASSGVRSGMTGGEEKAKSYLRYEEENKRKEHYFAYQIDSAEKTRKLKHWIVYDEPPNSSMNKDQQESEEYEFINAELKLSDNGEIEVYYHGQQEEQNQAAIAEVEPSLLERAEKFLQKELGHGLNDSNQPPDFIIPKPYYIDNQGNYHYLDWQINKEKNILTLDFSPQPDEYPLALDPTLEWQLAHSADKADVTITGEAGTSGFGYALTAGDFNADGKIDLAIGAYYYNSQQGRVYIFTSQNRLLNTNRSIVGDIATGKFGYSIVSADLDADGQPDLVVGAPDYSSNTGRVYIFTDDLTPDYASSADAIIVGEAVNNYFGRSLITGDFNQDGTIDLAAGADGYNSNQGRVYIFNNDGAYPDTASTADNIITGENTGDYFGHALAAADLNDNGTTTIDLVVGSYGYSSDTGRVYIFDNDGAYPSAAGSADTILFGENSSQFGRSLATGDLNADGIIDLAVGAPAYATNTGRAYLFYNDGTYPLGASTSDRIITGVATGTYFGYSILASDVTADNKDDLVVGAYGYDTNTGRVYLFKNNNGDYPIMANSNDLNITGDNTNNYFGTALTAGDWDYDGSNDLIIGAYGHSSNLGKIYFFTAQDNYVFFLQEQTETFRVLTHGGQELKITGEGKNNSFGYAVVASDLNNRRSASFRFARLLWKGPDGNQWFCLLWNQNR